MEVIFTRDYQYFWMAVLAVALFFPVRHFIWVLYVRRAERETQTDDTERARLKRRAGVTSALLSFVFSFVYVMHLFQGRP